MLHFSIRRAFLCVFFFSASLLLAQNQIARLYRPAPTKWLREAGQSATRTILPLNDTWKLVCDEPRLNAAVEIPGAYFFEGEVLFERVLPRDSVLLNQAVRLHMYGINHEAQIVLNDETIASHVGGYTHFVVDFGYEGLRAGRENLLQITVENHLSPLNTLPPSHRPRGWRNEGGILREIYLEVLPEIHLLNSEFRPRFQAGEVWLTLKTQIRHRRNLPAQAWEAMTCALEVWDQARSTRLASSPALTLSPGAGEKQELQLECKITQPALWSPARPSMYAVRAVLSQGKTLVDELWQETGFRQISIDGKKFLLNGEPLVLRGANWIEEYGNNSALLDSAYLSSVLTTLRQLGMNALRVVGHPPHPLLPTLCDRAGIFLLEELPLYYLTEAHFTQPRFQEMAELQAREMILRDRHHPSVLAWGLGTGSAPISEAAQKAVADLVAEMRGLDDRLLFIATPPGWRSLWNMQADFMLLDWPQRIDADSLAALEQNSPKPVLPVLGHWVSQGGSAISLSPGASQSRAEEVQAEYFARALPLLGALPQFKGYFVQALMDWQGPMPLLAVGPQEENEPAVGYANSKDWSAFHFSGGSRLHPFGLVDAVGQRRLAFQVVQAFNRGERNPIIVTRRFPPAPLGVFQVAGVALILLFLFFLQRDRRLRSNLRRVFVHPHGFYVDVYENRKVAPFLTLVLGLAESCILALLLAQFCYAFRQSFVLDQMLNLILDNPAWKATVVWLVWNPAWFITWGTVAFLCAGILLGILLRIVGFFVGSGLPSAQYFTFVYWAWANLLVLGVLAPVFHRLLLEGDLVRPLLFIVIAVLLWLVGRMFRALTVMYMISYVRAAVLFIVVFGGLGASLLLYLDRTRALFKYLPYYFEMIKAAG